MNQLFRAFFINFFSSLQYTLDEKLVAELFAFRQSLSQAMDRLSSYRSNCITVDNNITMKWVFEETHKRGLVNTLNCLISFLKPMSSDEGFNLDEFSMEKLSFYFMSSYQIYCTSVLEEFDKDYQKLITLNSFDQASFKLKTAKINAISSNLNPFLAFLKPNWSVTDLINSPEEAYHIFESLLGPDISALYELGISIGFTMHNFYWETSSSKNALQPQMKAITTFREMLLAEGLSTALVDELTLTWYKNAIESQKDLGRILSNSNNPMLKLSVQR